VGDVGQQLRTEITIILDLRPSTVPAIAPDEPLPAAIQRISIGLLDEAIGHLAGHGEQDFDTGIHMARKAMKRLRAILRLVRDDLGRRTYRSENVVIRDTARTIGRLRDASVLVGTLETLRQHSEDLLAAATFSETDKWLMGRYERERSAVTTDVITRAVLNLATARARFRAFPLTDRIDDDFSAIAPGIRRVYRRGRHGYLRSLADPTTEDLHDWRKRAKYLWFQMEALEPLRPGPIRATAQELEDLGEILGKDHDLAVLADAVQRGADACRDERERALLMALIDTEREHLQTRAFRAGSGLYAERPRAFVDRIGAYWDSGRR
jgi:CHAD domain-containing protein